MLALWIAATVFSALPALTSGQSTLQLNLNEAAAPSANVTPGDTILLEVAGNVNGHFALALSNAAAAIPTPFGILGVSFFDASFRVPIDGFNPAAPSFTQGILDGAGSRTFAFQPFALSTPPGAALYMQGLMAAVDAPLGFVLSNVVTAVLVPEAPVVDTLMPRLIGRGQTITLVGQNFGGNFAGATPPTVWIDDVPLTLTSFGDDFIEADLPMNVHSGYLRVVTPGGVSNVAADAIKHWVCVTVPPAEESGAETIVLSAPTTIMGQIAPNVDRDTFVVSLNAGDELFADLLPFSNQDFDVFAYTASSYGAHLDPTLEIAALIGNGESIGGDDNSGPGFGSAIGCGGAPRFIVPFTGDYRVTVGSGFGFTGGHYVLNLFTSPLTAPVQPRILRVEPNVAAPGYSLDLIAWGLDMTNAAANVIEFPAGQGSWIAATPTLAANGLLSVVVPAGATPGQIRARSAMGLVSGVDADDFASHVFIMGSAIPEDPAPTPQTILLGMTIIGSIATQFEADTFHVYLAAGQSIAVRAYPFDPMSGRLLKGALFSAVSLDPEIVIQGSSGTPVYTSDVHSGPGYSAELGGLARPAWVAPFSGTFQIVVRPWFFLSLGAYVLDVRGV
jgi:hypothetical protein